jgi:hypothetical protein
MVTNYRIHLVFNQVELQNGYDNNTGEPYEEKIGNGEMRLKLHSDFFWQ